MTDPVFPAALKNVRPLRGANVIAVASGKGGVGKTWFSITLSHALTKAGMNTLLFDGDLGLANVDIQLGFSPKNDLGAVITGCEVGAAPVGGAVGPAVEGAGAEAVGGAAAAADTGAAATPAGAVVSPTEAADPSEVG